MSCFSLEVVSTSLEGCVKMFEKDQNSCSENSQEKKGGEVYHAGLRADSAQLFSCVETTGPRQNRRGSPLTSERCVQSTRVDRSVSARLITTVSQAQWFKRHWQRLTGYQVVACVHRQLRPYGSKSGISVNRRTRETNTVSR